MADPNKVHCEEVHMQLIVSYTLKTSLQSIIYSSVYVYICVHECVCMCQVCAHTSHEHVLLVEAQDSGSFEARDSGR